MPSLVDFTPLIEAQKEVGRMERASADRRAALIQQGLQTAAYGIEKAGELGRAREREFQSMFDYDLNKVANKEARGYLVSRYSQIKRDGLKAFKSNKNILGYGKLTPEQRIELEDQLDSFAREAHLLNVVNEQIGNAEKLKSERPTAIKVDNEAIGTYLELLKPDQNGQYNVDGMAKFLSETRKSPTGQAFTTYANWDAEEHLKQSVMPLQKEIGPQVSLDTVIKDKGDKRYTTVYETTKYGTEEQRKTNYFQMLNNSKNADQYNYKIGESLTYEERTEAMAEFGGKELNPYSAYFAYHKADLNTGFEDQKRVKSTRVSPLADTGDGEGGGKGFIKIPKTEIGYEFGTTPVPITKPINGTTYKNASVVSVKQGDNGEYFAEVVVPRGQNESFVDMIAKREEQGGDISNTEATNFLMEMLNDNKVKTIEVPLEDIYNELDVGFKKKKIFLPGYKDITFEPKEDDLTTFVEGLGGNVRK